MFGVGWFVLHVSINSGSVCPRVSLGSDRANHALDSVTFHMFQWTDHGVFHASGENGRLVRFVEVVLRQVLWHCAVFSGWRAGVCVELAKCHSRFVSLPRVIGVFHRRCWRDCKISKMRISSPFTVESSRVSFETTWRHGTVRCSTICTLADVMLCVSFRLRGRSLQSASPITASVIYGMFQERFLGFASCRSLQTALSFPPHVAIGVRRSVTGSRFFGGVGESRVSHMCPVLIAKDMETPLGHRILFLDIANVIFLGYGCSA